MRTNNDFKKKYTIYVILMAIFFFYGYSRSFLYISAINWIARFTIYGFLAIMLLRTCLLSGRLKCSKMNLYFALTSVIPICSLIFTSLRSGQYSETISYTVMYICGVMLILVGKEKSAYGVAGINVIMGYSAIYTFCTYLFMVMPWFYRSVVIKLFNEDSRATLLKTYDSGYMPGLTSHYSTNGMYLSIACCFIIGIIIQKLENKSLKKKHVLIFLIFFGALGLTGKRGPFLFVLFAAALTLYIYYSNRPKHRIFVFAIYGFAVIILLIVVSAFMPSVLNSLSRLLEYFNSDGRRDVTAGRGVLYALAWTMFMRNPILGNGWASYKRESVSIASLIGQANNGTTLQVHNVFLQLLCEIGLIGTILFLIPWLYYFFRTIKLFYDSRKKRIVLPEHGVLFLACSTCYQIYFWTYSFTGNPLYDICTLFPLFFSVYLTGYVIKKAK